jgi:hypothetical protein
MGLMVFQTPVPPAPKKEGSALLNSLFYLMDLYKDIISISLLLEQDKFILIDSFGGKGCSSVAEHLPSMHNALDLIPGPPKKIVQKFIWRE